ncbi:vegetative cell wall protein gp1 [Anopheles stephensi]|uniref:vegetative cell wall protein gp1 n=1 Tax=Anopheles stephensi TaxID=30069 RepID=UPI001658A69C|nr:vegetative cell wall protein gp1 [Anopheles stephensi]
MNFIVSLLLIGVTFFLICWMIRCCCTRRSKGAIISPPVVIISDVHREAPRNTTTQVHTIVQGHPTGTSAYPAIPAAYPAQHPAPYPAQPYMQHYPLQTSAAPPTAPPHQQPTPVQFPSLPNTGMQYPAPPAASAMPGPPDARMFNPPSYDQVVAESLPVQPPYNPNFKG